MNLYIYGISYKTAPDNIRESFALAGDNLSTVLLDLMNQAGIFEVFIISTCLRTEFYCYTDNEVCISNWLIKYFGLSKSLFKKYFYLKQDQDAFTHMLRVASGLDSIFIGETQILGQIKKAFAIAEQNKTIGPELHIFITYIFNAIKKIRTQTKISSNQISLQSTVISIAKSLYSHLSNCNALLIGSGDTIDLIAKYLYSNGLKNIYITNRTTSKAQQVAKKYSAYAVPNDQISKYISKVDIIISATSCGNSLITDKILENGINNSVKQQILIVDLGIPRNISNKFKTANNVKFFTLDDILKIANDSIRHKLDACVGSEKIISLIVKDFEEYKNLLKSKHLICQFRNNLEAITNLELKKAFKSINSGNNVYEIINKLAHAITNKFLHSPTIQMRYAARKGRNDIMQIMQELFKFNNTC